MISNIAPTMVRVLPVPGKNNDFFEVNITKNPAEIVLSHQVDRTREKG